MRELEDEGKVMALADYAAPIADDDNPLLSWIRVRDGVIETARAGHALQRALARIHWRYPNEQFAYLAQRVVEQTCVALARDAVRLTGLDRLALAGGVVSNVRATRRIRAPARGGGRLRLSAHGRRRPGAGGGGGGGVRMRASRSTSISTRLDLGPSYATPAIAAALRAAGFQADTGRRPRRRASPTLLARGANRHVVSGAHGVRSASARAPQRAGAAGPARPAGSP